MTDHGTGGDSPSTGRSSGPADSVAGQLRTPRVLEDLGVKLGHTLGREIDRTIRNRHRRHLRRVGQEHALDASTFDFAQGTPPRDGNTIEVLIDGSEALPRMAADMAAATSHVHLTGWFLSPELALSREEEPLVVRILLAELAEKVDVRVLLWKGAPIPAFRPSRGDVREMERTLARHTKIRDRARLLHWSIALPPREDDRDRRPDRVRRRHRPHPRRRRSVRHPESPRPRRHRLARRRGADRRAGRARRGGALPPALAARCARGASRAEAARAGRRRGRCR